MELYNISETRNRLRMHGDVWLKTGKNLSREQILDYPDRNFKNLIVDVCSDLIAEWAITGTIAAGSSHVRSSAADYPGILSLAVGTGAVGWDLQNPPAETAGQVILNSELTRKTFASTSYTDGLGNPSVTRTNIVDFLTTFLEAEAVGPLVEMGLFGGNNSLLANGGTMVNAKNFAVVNKSATSQLSILWRLTF
jgi:hypothetical protein